MCVLCVTQNIKFFRNSSHKHTCTHTHTQIRDELQLEITESECAELGYNEMRLINCLLIKSKPRF